MIFPYQVKHNGVYYPAGTDVPVGGAPITEPVVEEKPVVEETPKPKAAPKKKTTKR